MVDTVRRKANFDISISDGHTTVNIKKGDELLTTKSKKGMVTVFKNAWFKWPTMYFEKIKDQ